MKIFFDTNVYVAEALLGGGARRIIEATAKGRWRIFTSHHVLRELEQVLVEDFDFSRRLAFLAQQRVIRRASVVRSAARAEVPGDPQDSPILQAAVACGADYLVTNDQHLRDLDPFRGLHIIPMNEFHTLLEAEGLL